MPVKVAVYGTLRRGQPNHYILEGSKYVGTDRIHGELFTHGGFPGLVPNRNGDNTSVVVEVYEVSDATLARLDRLEGVPTHYERGKALLEEQGIVVDTYYYQVPVDSLIRIPTGDWMDFAMTRSTRFII